MAEAGMDQHYVRRFRVRLWKDASAWARDNILWAVAMLLIPLVVTYFQDRKHLIDWQTAITACLLYLVVFVIYFIVNCGKTAYLLDVERSVIAVSLENELTSLREEKKKQQTDASRSEWLYIADRFKPLPYLRGDWQITQGVTTWSPVHEKECRSLCVLAGTLLLRSERLPPEFPYSKLSEADPLILWLECIKAMNGSVQGSHMIMTEALPDGTTQTSNAGSVEIPKNSANMCIEFAAYCAKGVSV